MRIVKTIIIVGVLLLLLVACSNDSSHESSGDVSNINITGSVDNTITENYIYLPEQTVITVGGIWVSQAVQRFVTAFNRENQDYQIEIRCYDTLYGWEAGETRFNIDMIAGQGPDVIVGQSVEALEDTARVMQNRVSIYLSEQS